MVWIVIIGLVVWGVVLQRRLGALEARLREAERELRRSASAPAAETPWRRAAALPVGSGFAAPSAPPEPVADTLTPAPRLGQDESAPTPGAPVPRPPAEPAPAVAGPARATDLAQPVAQRLRATPPPQMSAWLAENGLAWIGGGALVLGGLFLVAYAAQQGFFTPILRLVAALILAGGMLGTGEVIRRSRAESGRHLLVAAVLSGAGAATLYGTIWSAWALYGYIEALPAGLTMGAVCAGVLGLALLHGEALAVLALLGGFLAPAICRAGLGVVGVDAFVVAVSTTGSIMAGVRGWRRAGIASLAGTGIWVLARQLDADDLGAGGLLVAGVALAVLGEAIAEAERRPAGLALAGVIGGSVLWPALAAASRLLPIVPIAEGVAIIAAAGLAARLRLAPGRILFAPAAALAIVTAGAFRGSGAGTPTLLGGFLAPAALAAAGAIETWRGEDRRWSALAGAGGAALSLTLLVASSRSATGPTMAIALAAMAAAAAAATELLARVSPDRRTDLAIAAWVGAAVEIAGLAVRSALAGPAEPVGYAAIAAVVAIVAARRPTSGLPQAVAIAAVASFVFALRPVTVGVVLAGGPGAFIPAAWVAAAAGVQLAAWLVLRRAPGARRAPTEAVSTAAAITGLLAAFLMLRLAAMSGAHPGLDAFTEAALTTDLLTGAGLALTLGAGDSLLSRARGPLLLGLGAVHAGLVTGEALHPWWGFAESRIALIGPPIVDAAALAFLAPAAALALAARRLRGRMGGAAIAGAGAGLVLAWLWAITEIRRLTHGPHLDLGATGHGELAAYGVTLMVAGLGAGAALPRVSARARVAATRICGLLLGLGFIVTAFLANPWWGPVGGDLRDPILLAISSIAAIGFLAVAARAAGAQPSPRLAAAFRVLAVLQAVVLGTLAVRYGFHGPAMRTPLAEAGVETWAFSAAWAAFGLAILVGAARWRDRELRWLGLILLLLTTLKVFLFDMATLQGVVRAASFLALGVLLIIAALAARRMGGGVARSAPEDRS